MTNKTTNNFREFGKEFTDGALNTIGKYGVTLFLIIFLLYFFVPIDDCDRAKFDRCGMSIKTDNKTGLQYLVTSSGGIIPRLDINGNQLRAENDK